MQERPTMTRRVFLDLQFFGYTGPLLEKPPRLMTGVMKGFQGFHTHENMHSCWDSNALHGHQLHRTIQPTQWSRRAGIAGLPTFDVFPWLLAYHGTADYSARKLSHGKYCGFIPTRSVSILCGWPGTS